MSFFLTPSAKAKRKPITKPKTTPSKPTNRLVASMQRLGCAACKLNTAPVKTSKMTPQLAPQKGGILVIGGAPDEREDETGKSFSNETGKLLRSLIPYELKSIISYDNIINCRTDEEVIVNEVQCCHNRRVRVIQEQQPKLIIGLGVPVLQSILGSSDIHALRGRLSVVKIGNHTCHSLSTFHPNDVVKFAFNKEKPLNSQYGHCFRHDIEYACSVYDELELPEIVSEEQLRSSVRIFDGSKETDFKELINCLEQAYEALILAIDIETQNVRPFGNGSKLLTVAISFDDKHFAFSVHHKDSKWGAVRTPIIMEDLRQILLNNNIKICHNVPFEVEWFADYYGPEVVNHHAWECTQLQAHFLDERKGTGRDDDNANPFHSLDFLCKTYFGLAFKGLFKLDKKDMENQDLTETLIYNGVDTYQTLRLWHYQNKLLKQRGLYDVYKKSVWRQPTVALMQLLGMPVDQNRVKEFQNKLSSELQQIDTDIKGLDIVKKFIQDKGSFNPAGEDAITLFRDYLKRKEIQVQDGKQLRWSVDKNVLDKIDHPLAKLIVKLRNVTKMKSTYVDELELGVGKYIYPDGKIHCNFNTTFTTTGRTSSSNPNCQNFPQRSDSWVRKQIIAPPGHKIIAADYGQLEACSGAMCSRDPYLVKVLWEDYDTHMFWSEVLNKVLIKHYGKEKAIEIIGDFSDPKIAKKIRSRIKNKLVFPAFFGAQNKSIAGYLNLDLTVIDDVMKQFWKTFAGFKDWQDVTMRKYYEVGYVESPSGRRRHLPMTRNEAINASIQGQASDIVCDAMCRLSYIAVSQNKMWLHPRLNIHDDISLISPDEHVEEAIEIVVHTMLTPKFDCVNVPLSVTVSVGQNWGEMSEVGKFWSHKDV
jgi:uracil-DNA glycosylase family 4